MRDYNFEERREERGIGGQVRTVYEEKRMEWNFQVGRKMRKSAPKFGRKSQSFLTKFCKVFTENCIKTNKKDLRIKTIARGLDY